jgi:hypothetical protein
VRSHEGVGAGLRVLRRFWLVNEVIAIEYVVHARRREAVGRARVDDDLDIRQRTSETEKTRLAPPARPSRATDPLGRGATERLTHSVSSCEKRAVEPDRQKWAHCRHKLARTQGPESLQQRRSRRPPQIDPKQWVLNAVKRALVNLREAVASDYAACAIRSLGP